MNIKITRRDLMFYPDGTRMYPETEMKDMQVVEAPASNNVVKLETLSDRLARGGNFWGGGGNGDGEDGENKPNWLRLIPPGTRVLAKMNKLKASFTLDVFLIYHQMDNVTALEPIVPGMDAGIWYVDNQQFSNAYKLYTTIQTQEETESDERNRTD